MKSVLIAIAVMVAGLSSGCAQMDQLAKQYNPDNAKFPGLRPAETVESRAAERRQYDTEQAKRYAQQVEHARIDAASLRERELLVYGSLNRVRVAQGAQGKDELFDSQGYRAGGMTDEERDFIDWVEKPNSTVAEMKNTLMVREIKLIAEAKADAKNQRKYEKAEQAKFANQQAEYARIIKNQQAQYAAKLKADADALEAARIERRDHPEIGAARDRARDKARREQLQAEEDVYRANHGGRSKTDDDMAVLEKDANRYLLERKLQQSLRGY
mgnify:FL=1